MASDTSVAPQVLRERERAPESQIASAALMVRPASFGFNSQSGRSNHFAFAGVHSSMGVERTARDEFDGLVRELVKAGIDVVLLEDTADPPKPDAVFSNNWMSFHADGTAVLYPMANHSRRIERRKRDVEDALFDAGFGIERWIDLTYSEERGQFLEGTGSLVLDRSGKKAFACISLRTDPVALAAACNVLKYAPVPFEARDPSGRPIYHTNVMMSVGRRFAVVCLDSIVPQDRQRLVEELERGGREIIAITWEQVCAFAANIIEVGTKGGLSAIALSSRAFFSLTDEQRSRLSDLGGPLVHAPIPTIETLGGGGVRCSITEIHLPRRRSLG